jgi:uncharacterized protein
VAKILPETVEELAMIVNTSERTTKRSAEPGKSDWSADATLAEIIRRILASANRRRSSSSARARGDARADSDYGLLLVGPSALPRHKRAARYRRALTGLAGAKDILVWTPEEVTQWREVPNAFVTTAVQEGVVYYERPLRAGCQGRD